MNGLATGFILSQTSVVLATLTGIWFLGQKKTAKEMTVTIIGLVLILAAYDHSDDLKVFNDLLFRALNTFYLF